MSKNIKKIAYEYLYIAFSSFILAFAVNFFLVPSKISTGGLNGVGTVLLYMFNIPLSVTTIVINAVLFVVGYKTLKIDSLYKTIAGICFLSLFLEVTTVFGFYGQDKLICAIFGGTLAGVGVGMCVLKNASTGGSDFASLMLHKIFPHISISYFIMIIDAVVIVVSGVAFRDYTIMFYSVIALYFATKMTDFILVRGDFAKYVLIVSEKSCEIADEIMLSLQRGVTGIYSKGFYNNEDKIMLMCVVRSREVSKLTSIVTKIDKKAFVVVSDSKKVLGEGFSSIEI